MCGLITRGCVSYLPRVTSPSDQNLLATRMPFIILERHGPKVCELRADQQGYRQPYTFAHDQNYLKHRLRQ
jgi:hypothetical protein